MSTDFQQARIALGVRLRELRAEAGLTGRDLATRCGWLPSKVSKLENGRQTPKPADLTAWAAAVGKPAAAAELKGRLTGLEVTYRSWRRQLATGHRARQESAAAEHLNSRVIRAYEATVVPGIFQTADYARHLLQHSADLRQTPRDTEAAVRARMKRQASLYEPGRVFHALVWEAALHVRICPPGALAAQLDRLAGLIGLDTVRLGIIPFEAALTITPRHGFWIYDERLVIVETINAEMWLDDPADIALYGKAWDRLSAASVHGRTAHRLIARARAALDLA
ncbi:helix-turn-helix domain-containing protein [Streptomyces sp. NBC_01477]|uniref:helix-turn-helix domain-containing protein n=1 Tax=Streptomyces sp. NBC_01477 TaxID=2976015 RepID=UPI002E372A7D|nr:helix-turn-helix transcriptional regulator [Streptomyces sp. NBC_01477]